MKAEDKEFKARQGSKELLKTKTSKQGAGNTRVTMYPLWATHKLRMVKNGSWDWRLSSKQELQERAEAENWGHRLQEGWELDKVVALNKCFLR